MGEMIQANLRDAEEQLWKQYVSQAEHLPACQRAVADPNFDCSKIHRRNRTVFFSNLMQQNQGLKSLSEIVYSEETQLLVHLPISITSINVSKDRGKGSGHGKLLHVVCSPVAMPNDLFCLNNFALSVHSLCVYLVTLLISWPQTGSYLHFSLTKLFQTFSGLINYLDITLSWLGHLHSLGPSF